MLHRSRPQILVPDLLLSFHLVRLFIANFNRRNNKKQVMELGNFTDRKNVIQLKLPAGCEHNLSAHEQQFSQKPRPLLQNHVKVRKAKTTVPKLIQVVNPHIHTQSKQIKCKHKCAHKPQLSPCL